MSDMETYSLCITEWKKIGYKIVCTKSNLIYSHMQKKYMRNIYQEIYRDQG